MKQCTERNKYSHLDNNQSPYTVLIITEFVVTLKFTNCLFWSEYFRIVKCHVFNYDRARFSTIGFILRYIESLSSSVVANYAYNYENSLTIIGEIKKKFTLSFILRCIDINWLRQCATIFAKRETRGCEINVMVELLNGFRYVFTLTMVQVTYSFRSFTWNY